MASLRLRLNREQAASELLADAGALMEDALDQRERAQHLADLAVNGLGDVAMVDIVMADGSIQRMAAKGKNTELADLFVQLRAGTPIDPHGPHPVAEVIRTGRTMYLDQLSDKEIDQITTRENERELLRAHRFKSCIVLPLGARGSVLGALTLWIIRPAKAFDETARRTARRLADRAALALDNARLHEQQSHIASVLQHSLLPRSLPEIGASRPPHASSPAGEAYEVGGDFYDVFRSGSGAWTAVIGDVCGKGPEAASLTALARYTVRTASSPDSAPSQVLRTLHDSISSEQADMRFCTAALARIEAPSNGRGSARLTVALGGHPLPLILRKNGHVDAVGEPGTLLGALPSPVLADADATLAVGDSLILYTDGMLDVRDRSISDDPEWLAQRARQVGRQERRRDRGGAVAGRDQAPRRRAARRHRRARAAPQRRSLTGRPVHVGCSGWAYPHWRERFYPKGLPQRRWLAYYAERFDTVEINNTFYRLPKPRRPSRAGSSRALPASSSPVKASRYLTHVKRLKTLDPYLERFFEPLEALTRSEKLGPLLWQFPANFHRNDERLSGALQALPPGRHAFEFRHESWFTDEVYALLREHGAALVIGDESSRWVSTPHVRTADWTYIRFHHGARGRHGNYSRVGDRDLGAPASPSGGETPRSTSTSTTTGRATPSATRGC